jgi:hypothetical protein
MRPVPVRVTGPGKHGTRRRVLRGNKAAVIYGGDVQRCGGLGVHPSGKGRRSQIAEALSQNVTPVTGKWARSATIS